MQRKIYAIIVCVLIMSVLTACLVGCDKIERDEDSPFFKVDMTDGKAIMDRFHELILEGNFTISSESTVRIPNCIDFNGADYEQHIKRLSQYSHDAYLKSDDVKRYIDDTLSDEYTYKYTSIYQRKDSGVNVYYRRGDEEFSVEESNDMTIDELLDNEIRMMIDEWVREEWIEADWEYDKKSKSFSCITREKSGPDDYIEDIHAVMTIKDDEIKITSTADTTLNGQELIIRATCYIYDFGTTRVKIPKV